MNFSIVEKNIGYRFKDRRLLMRALTLASYDNKSCNETLEFFGDAIIEFIVSEKIFALDADEGELTERRKDVVSDAALTPISKRLKLDENLIKGEGDNRNKKAVPSVYEAIVAAIYLDGGMDAAKEFVLSTLDFSFKDKDENFKGGLQETLQKRGAALPEYSVRDIGTPQHPSFEAAVNVFGKTYKGWGENKQKAEQDAAAKALDALKKRR